MKKPCLVLGLFALVISGCGQSKLTNDQKEIFFDTHRAALSSIEAGKELRTSKDIVNANGHTIPGDTTIEAKPYTTLSTRTMSDSKKCIRSSTGTGLENFGLSIEG